MPDRRVFPGDLTQTHSTACLLCLMPWLFGFSPSSTRTYCSLKTTLPQSGPTSGEAPDSGFPTSAPPAYGGWVISPRRSVDHFPLNVLLPIGPWSPQGQAPPAVLTLPPMLPSHLAARILALFTLCISITKQLQPSSLTDAHRFSWKVPPRCGERCPKGPCDGPGSQPLSLQSSPQRFFPLLPLHRGSSAPLLLWLLCGRPCALSCFVNTKEEAGESGCIHHMKDWHLGEMPLSGISRYTYLKTIHFPNAVTVPLKHTDAVMAALKFLFLITRGCLLL